MPLRGAAQPGLAALALSTAQLGLLLSIQSPAQPGPMLSVRMLELGCVLPLCSALGPGSSLLLRGVARLGFVSFALDAATSDLFPLLRSFVHLSSSLFVVGSCRAGSSLLTSGMCHLGLLLSLHGVSHVGLAPFVLRCTTLGSLLSLRSVA